jgi:hypothetical protein
MSTAYMKIISDRPDDYCPREFFISWYGLYKKKTLLLEKHESYIRKKFYRENRFNRYSGYLRSYKLKQRYAYRATLGRRTHAGKSFLNFWIARQPIE